MQHDTHILKKIGLKGTLNLENYPSTPRLFRSQGSGPLALLYVPLTPALPGEAPRNGAARECFV